MKFENEITVEVDTNLDNLILLLTKHNFKLNFMKRLYIIVNIAIIFIVYLCCNIIFNLFI